MAPLVELAAGSKEFENIMFYKVNSEEAEVLLSLSFYTPATLPTP